MNMLSYAFMQRALIVAVLIGIMTPIIGVTIVLKRLSLVGDSLSHSSLAGVAAGLAFGFNPVVGAISFSLVAAFGIERIRKLFPKYAEIAIAIIMSTGIGLAGVLSGFVKNSANFSSFLFGSIVAISNFELMIVLILSGVVITALVLLYKELFYLTFDEESARLAGIPVRLINTVFTIMMALTISVSARTVGALVVSSLMVIPVALAMQVAKSYKQTLIIAVVSGVLFTLVGLTVSFYANLRPGATIVLVGVVSLVVTILVKNLVVRSKVRQMNNEAIE